MNYFYTKVFCLNTILFFIALLSSLLGQAVTVDSIYIEPVEIHAARLSVEERYLPFRLTRIVLDEHVASTNSIDLLAGKSPIFIKNQGNGLVATSASRGYTPEQTTIAWNGLKLNHPMLGLFDLSLIPVEAFETIEISSGTSSSDIGGGSVGDYIGLTSAVMARPFVGFKLGSYGLSSFSGGVNQSIIRQGDRSGDKWSLLGFWNKAKNDFRYKNSISLKTENRRNNDLESGGLLAGFRSDLFNRRTESFLWIQSTRRSIPGPVGAPLIDTDQFDKTIHFSSSISLKQGENPWKLLAGGGVYQLDYIRPDPSGDRDKLRSLSKSYRFQLNSINRLIYRSNWWLESEQSLTWAGVNTNNYTDFKQRTEGGLSLRAVIQTQNGLRFYPRVRLDFITDYGQVISPSLGVNYSINKVWSLRAETSYNYNSPSFNSLYWPLSGNPDLKPEKSIKTEAGFSMLKRWNFVRIDWMASLYYASVENEILWLSDSHTGLFTPRNIQESLHRGIEQDVRISINLHTFEIEAGHITSFTKATIEKSRFTNDKGVGKQLRYIPEVQLKQWISLQRGGINLLVNSEWTSQRYTRDDNSKWLDSYHVINGSLSYRKSLYSTKLTMALRIENLYKTKYEIIAGYPMPEQHILISTTLTF